jgi:tripartite-type tricarboxylate transporter receptor subunit TctC
MEELGHKVYSSAWYGLMAPAKTPKAIIDKLGEAANQALQTPKTRDRILGYGAEIGGGTPAWFAAFIDEELKRYKPIVEASGAKLD